jgi:hypothetical protein
LKLLYGKVYEDLRQDVLVSIQTIPVDSSKLKERNTTTTTTTTTAIIIIIITIIINVQVHKK